MYVVDANVARYGCSAFHIFYGFFIFLLSLVVLLFSRKGHWPMNLALLGKSLTFQTFRLLGFRVVVLDGWDDISTSIFS